jgi:hypothetical protein
MNAQTLTPTNTLESFIRLNLSSKMFELAYLNDRDLLMSLYGDSAPEFNAVELLDKLQGTYAKKLVLRNHQIALDLQRERMFHTEPKTGDVLIDDLGNKFYLSRIYDDHFQYAVCGSFHMYTSGSASFSGGYAFNGVKNGVEIGSFKVFDLEEVKDQNNSRVFWFFMDHSAGAHRGINFNSRVKTWKFKK